METIPKIKGLKCALRGVSNLIRGCPGAIRAGASRAARGHVTRERSCDSGFLSGPTRKKDQILLLATIVRSGYLQCGLWVEVWVVGVIMVIITGK